VSSPTILLSAGEPSGDLHGAALAAAIQRRWPGAKLFGLGGPRMAEAGVELLADFRRLAVMGFAEVIGQIPFFLRLLRQLRSELDARRPDLVIPIDYPGFNMRLSRDAKLAGVPVLYYIAPQVWAWHRSRMRRLAELADRLAVILPFEERLFRDAGARAEFVGHPLLDGPFNAGGGEELAAELGLDPARPVVALFPGSRAQEVARHGELFLEVAARIQRAVPSVQPVLAVSDAVPAEAYASVPYPRTRRSRELLVLARAALVKSGTTTLEAALSGTPMVIAYRTHPLTYWLARRLVRVDHIGLVNLVAGSRVAPEYIQSEATPDALADALLPLLEPGHPEREAALEALALVRASLHPRSANGASSTADRVAGIAAELLGEGG
jgi:lipid-A-disaccharide synthase